MHDGRAVHPVSLLTLVVAGVSIANILTRLVTGWHLILVYSLYKIRPSILHLREGWAFSQTWNMKQQENLNYLASYLLALISKLVTRSPTFGKKHNIN